MNDENNFKIELKKVSLFSKNIIYKYLFNGLKNIKEYIGIIVLLPSLLGGIWQLYALSKISISYIRFFSISQLIPDGIIVFIFLIFLFLIIILNISLILDLLNLLNYLFKDYLNKIKNIAYDTIERKSSLIKLLLIFCLPTIILFFLMILDIVYLKNINLFYKILINTFIVALFIIYLYIIDTLKNKFIELKSLYSLNSIFILGITIIIFEHLLISFGTNYQLPQNLINIDEISEKIKKENSSNNIDILYMNDKYIFIRLITEKIPNGKIDTINKIKIIKFEDLINTFEKDKQEVNKISKIKY